MKIELFINIFKFIIMQTIKNIGKYSIYIFFTLIFFGSCQPNDEPINQEELITTFIYTLVDSSGNHVILSFKDVDGSGGINPIYFVSGAFKANTTYVGRLDLLNESAIPVDTITNEIITEDFAHQFFYLKSSPLNAIFQYADVDKNGKPLGVKTSMTTGSPSIGTIKIILRHEPNKNALNVSQGDITNAEGETDIEVEFNIEVK